MRLKTLKSQPLLLQRGLSATRYDRVRQRGIQKRSTYSLFDNLSLALIKSPRIIRFPENLAHLYFLAIAGLLAFKLKRVFNQRVCLTILTAKLTRSQTHGFFRVPNALLHESSPLLGAI